jgi:predicted transcriptional regulator
MAPNLFETRVTELSKETDPVRENAHREESGKPGDWDPDELVQAKEKLDQLDREILLMDKQISDLMRVKEEELGKANQIIRQVFGDYEERGVLHYVLTHQDYQLSKIAESLGIREKQVKEVLERLSKIGLIAEEEM